MSEYIRPPIGAYRPFKNCELRPDEFAETLTETIMAEFKPGWFINKKLIGLVAQNNEDADNRLSCCIGHCRAVGDLVASTTR